MLETHLLLTRRDIDFETEISVFAAAVSRSAPSTAVRSTVR
jgi:hypothetical protein